MNLAYRQFIKNDKKMILKIMNLLINWIDVFVIPDKNQRSFRELQDTRIHDVSQLTNPNIYCHTILNSEEPR